MSEIVPAEPIEGSETYYEVGESSSSRPNVTLVITEGPSHRDDVPEPFDSERLPTIFASEIQRFLRVANLIEREEPRVAYLCT
ncbi:hypothetical protein K1719_029504 [Acacia pycnantha]|nr:hypothetical protein K1719_041963 [Acacia pycnantha]KAI9089225.1 hypothetical protein K1719_029504 [Acacia pycnantha]